MPCSKHVPLAALGLLALVLLGGCAQIAVYSTVGPDAVVEEYRFQIDTSRTVYGYIEQSAAEEGYGSVREAILGDMDLDDVGAESVEYDEEFDGDDVSMTLTFTNVDPAEFDDISISETDEGLVYEDSTFVDDDPAIMDQGETNQSAAFAAGFAVDYYLTMPGEIVESNADEVNGNTAEWHETGADAFTDTRIYAVSEPSTLVDVPGFGAGVAILAITLLSIGLLVASRDRA